MPDITVKYASATNGSKEAAKKLVKVLPDFIVKMYLEGAGLKLDRNNMAIGSQSFGEFTHNVPQVGVYVQLGSGVADEYVNMLKTLYREVNGWSCANAGAYPGVDEIDVQLFYGRMYGVCFDPTTGAVKTSWGVSKSIFK